MVATSRRYQATEAEINIGMATQLTMKLLPFILKFQIKSDKEKRARKEDICNLPSKPWATTALLDVRLQYSAR